jgi:hypothetical protein
MIIANIIIIHINYRKIEKLNLYLIELLKKIIKHIKKKFFNVFKKIYLI